MLEDLKKELLEMVKEAAGLGLDEASVGLSIQLTGLFTEARRLGLTDDELIDIVQQGMQAA